jgi:hypothetical protein
VAIVMMCEKLHHGWRKLRDENIIKCEQNKAEWKNGEMEEEGRMDKWRGRKNR